MTENDDSTKIRRPKQNEAHEEHQRMTLPNRTIPKNDAIEELRNGKKIYDNLTYEFVEEVVLLLLLEL
ncbi:11091_t:CDS:2 [Racocetra persica]|uniref:11091_t:CDS:1 n=1 Tax=Racocetra persica TaxID=160502 RepID=A0ACA9LY54_9GLOM|nr:11091_t:CDS:2 [Racocetra persica]